MVHQVGKILIDPQGQPLRLRAVNLGGWLLWEGWIFGNGILLSQTTILDRLQQLVGTSAAAAFQSQVYANFITEDDIARIAGLGFNAVRLPINARLLEEVSQPFVYKDSGWSILDALLSWCERYHIYVVLDLHAVPGGQSSLGMADPGPRKDWVWNNQANQNRTIALWQAIASRYHDRRSIAGYDLINEPAPSRGDQLVDLDSRIIAAIRKVDPYHLVIIEGSRGATDFSIFSAPLSGNQIYSFHMYTWFGDNRQKQLAYYRSISDAQQVPFWAGEFGENTYAMLASTIALYDDPSNEVNAGWAYWTWKKAPMQYPALLEINLPVTWLPVMNWIAQPGRYPQPTREQALAGMADFTRAIRLPDNVLDAKMADVLSAVNP
ncbi:MAG: cellulase family glycosylhydrolase [Anaerolineales bacterium]|jgi:hypothetical protein